MNRFSLTFATDNADFDDDAKWPAIARILRDVAEKVEHDGKTGGKIYDFNGNYIGSWSLS